MKTIIHYNNGDIIKSRDLYSHVLTYDMHFIRLGDNNALLIVLMFSQGKCRTQDIGGRD